MDTKRKWRVREDRISTINPNAYDKKSLNIGVGDIESAESMAQKYNFILNYQNFFNYFAA